MKMTSNTVAKLLLLVGVIQTITFYVTAVPQPWQYNVKYFESVTLNCTSDDTAEVRVWILPSGDVIDVATNTTETKHIQLVNNGSGLYIRRVDDDDFGLYFCVTQSEHSGINVIKKGINVGGPYYGPDVDERYKKNAAIGGVAAAVVFVVMVSIWIMCSKCGIRHSKSLSVSRKGDVTDGKQLFSITVNDEKIEEAFKLSDIHRVSQDINIYDQADGVDKLRGIPGSSKTTTPGLENNSDMLHQISAVRDSGHYQSITDVSSLEHGTNPQHCKGSNNMTLADNDFTNPYDKCENNIVNGGHNAQTDSVFTKANLASSAAATAMRDGCGFIIVTDSFLNLPTSSENQVPASNTTAADRDAIYAKPIKVRPKDITVEGDIVLESNGAKVVVTSSPNSEVIQTPPENSM